jgi:hypothetical protein
MQPKIDFVQFYFVYIFLVKFYVNYGSVVMNIVFI